MQPEQKNNDQHPSNHNSEPSRLDHDQLLKLDDSMEEIIVEQKNYDQYPTYPSCNNSDPPIMDFDLLVKLGVSMEDIIAAQEYGKNMEVYCGSYDSESESDHDL